MLALAVLAGGRVVDALRLALAMAFLQFSIGASNDVADAERDLGRVPPKPIPAGFVSVGGARRLASALALLGLLLVVPSGPTVLALALLGLACGLAYDVALSRTSMSWLPLALALPLVPLFAWLGATGSVSISELAILPIGVLAGAGLAVSNALIDIDVDRERGRRTVAVLLGPTASWWGQAVGLTAATLLVGAVLGWWDRPIVGVTVTAGALLVLVGLIGVRSREGGIRRLGWQIEAGGVVVLAVAWGLAVAPAG